MQETERGGGLVMIVKVCYFSLNTGNFSTKVTVHVFFILVHRYDLHSLIINTVQHKPFFISICMCVYCILVGYMPIY